MLEDDLRPHYNVSSTEFTWMSKINTVFHIAGFIPGLLSLNVLWVALKKTRLLLCDTFYYSNFPLSNFHKVFEFNTLVFTSFTDLDRWTLHTLSGFLFFSPVQVFCSLLSLSRRLLTTYSVL